MPKCDFNKDTLQLCFELVLRHGCSQEIFRTLFLRTPLGGCFWPVESQNENLVAS